VLAVQPGPARPAELDLEEDMHDRSLGRRLAVGWLIAAPAIAQATWIVDPENRAGAHFTDLPPAIAASSHGDTILVRSSTTASGISFTTTTDKGITIRGAGYHVFSGTLSVVGLPANQRFVMHGFAHGIAANWSGHAAHVNIQSCRGTVHLQGLSAFPFAPLGPASTLRISVGQSHHVTIRGCWTVGDPQGLTVTSSTVLAIGSQFTGTVSQTRFSGGMERWTYPAASITNSEVVAIDTVFAGGGGYTVPYWCTPVYPNRHGVSMNNSRLVLAGCSVSGGTATEPYCLNYLTPEPSAIGTGTIVHQATTLNPWPRGVAVSWGEHWITRSSPAAAGGNLQVRVAALPHVVAATFVSLPAPVLDLPFGQVWLDLSAITLIDLATLDFMGQRSFAVPSLMVPDGTPLMLQTAMLVGNTVRMTIPSVTVLAP
jgi:hypothetical protein